MRDVLVIGFISIDFVGLVEGLPTPGVPMQATDLDVACGSRAANQAMAVTALEGDVALLARVGSDEHATLLLDELVDIGVETAFVTQAPSATGLRMLAATPDGEVTSVVYRGANDYLSVDDLNRRLEAFSRARAVGVTTEPAGAVTLRALELARQAETPAFLTHAPSAKPVSDRVLAAADVVIVSDATCHGLLDPTVTREQPEAAARALVQRGARAVALLTAGRALLATADDIRQVPSPGRLDNEEAVDAFVAGMLHATAGGSALDDAVLQGVRVANLLVD